MLKILALSTTIAALAFGGCSQVETFLSSPATTTAANNAVKFTTAFACGLSAAAAAAQSVETTAYNGAPLVDATGQQVTAVVYASSSTACSLLKGVVVSSTPVTVAATAVAQ